MFHAPQTDFAFEEGWQVEDVKQQMQVLGTTGTGYVVANKSGVDEAAH